MISVCIITKNEAENLEKCLSKLSKYDCEIVIVDTGSTDNSKEIAKKYSDSIYDFQWCDDFSKARNYAADKADNDIIMMIDTDEFIDEMNMEELERLTRENNSSVGRIHRKNYYKTNGNDMIGNELISRVYNKNMFCYEGRIHEQIVSKSGTPYSTYVLPVYITHMGYAENEKKREEKAARNLSLLLQVLKEDKNNPYILYQIGKSYYYKGDYAMASEYFEKMFDIELNPHYEYVIDMITTYGYSLINSKQYEKALLLENLYDDFKHSADYKFMLGLVYMQNSLFENAINMFQQATAEKSCSVEGVNSYLAYYNIGVIYECLGDKANATKYYKKCGNYKQAQLRLKNL